MEQQQMVQEIVDFVTRNSQSHASRIVCQTALGDYHAQVDLQSRDQLLKNLQQIEYDDLEYCYYLIK